MIKWVTTDLVDFLREEYEGLIAEDENDDLEE